MENGSLQTSETFLLSAVLSGFIGLDTIWISCALLLAGCLLMRSERAWF